MMVSSNFLLLALAAVLSQVTAFAPGLQLQVRSPTFIKAGGFEWEDPGEVFDQGVENPFKNPSIGEDGMKIDPGRLLGPRLSGSNLYMIGMMGTGKSCVGDIVARRK